MSFRTVVETFEQVAAVSSRNAKIELLNKLASDPAHKETLREVVMYTYFPFWTYRITAPDTSDLFPKFQDLSDEQSDMMWAFFKGLLDSLKNRTVELTAGCSEVRSLIGTQPPLYQKYLKQIVNRDLKIGVSDFKRWFPSMIPAEPVMLCDKWDGESLNGDWIAEPKWDGYRAAVMVDAEGNCTAVSRGNKEFWNWDLIAAEIKNLGLRSLVIDGEFFAGTWGLTSSICKSQQSKVNKDLLKFFMFDMLTLEEWNQTQCSRTLLERKQDMASVLGLGCNYSNSNENGSSGLLQVTQHLVMSCGVRVCSQEDCSEAGDLFYRLGYEGAVLKRLNSTYVWRRVPEWLKIKPEEDCDLVVVGAEPGKGKHTGRLGALVVEGLVTYKKKQYSVMTRCGGGLSDKDREKFWEMHLAGTLAGTVVEVRYQDVSTEIGIGQGRPSLRFPRFVRVRDDKRASDVTGA